MSKVYAYSFQEKLLYTSFYLSEDEKSISELEEYERDNLSLLKHNSEGEESTLVLDLKFDDLDLLARDIGQKKQDIIKLISVSMSAWSKLAIIDKIWWNKPKRLEERLEIWNRIIEWKIINNSNLKSVKKGFTVFEGIKWIMPWSILCHYLKLWIDCSTRIQQVLNAPHNFIPPPEVLEQDWPTKFNI